MQRQRKATFFVLAAIAAATGPIGAGSASPAAGSLPTSAPPPTSATTKTRVEPVAPVHPAPSHFTHGRVDNAWYPLRPGTRYVFKGAEDGVRERDVVLVTYQTEVIDGVTCRAVHDRLIIHGNVRERTTDWFAQTKRGTVWYFGERTAELNPRGRVVSREGSWRSGRHGAEAGIFMPRHPRVGQSFLQENSPGVAVDRFRVLSLHAHATAPLISSHHALLTKETTRLEPGVVDHKLYVRDIGQVSEQTVRGGDEALHLVSLRHVPRG
jgi:hypothetical protein